MPKLTKAQAKAVDAAETNDIDYTVPLPAGRYIGTLDEVEVGEGPKGPYWTWKIKLDRNEDVALDGQGRVMYVNTSLAEEAAWKMKETFEAFGYSSDSDTEEMIGEKCIVVVRIKMIQGGANAGTPGNQVSKLFPLDGTVVGGSGKDEADADDARGF